MNHRGEYLLHVSVIMPVRNEAAYIERSLGAVMSQDYPADLIEILVVDGMSHDGTRGIVESLQARYPNLRIVDNRGKIAPTGLNAAIAQAQGEVIIRVDGHCEIFPDYVRRCVDHLQADGIDCVGGAIETIGESALARIIAIATGSRFGVGDSAFRTLKDKTTLTDTVAFPAYTRDILEQAGPFDEELVRNQDDEYNYRLRKMGVKILLAADIHSRYYARSSFKSLWLQYFRYGFWKVRVMQKHPRQMCLRQFVPPTFVAALIISAAMAPFIRWAQIFLFLVAGSYALADLIASVITASKQGWRSLPLLPLIFAILHLSYGSGFLIGLIRFANRWKCRSIFRPVQGEEAFRGERAF